MASISMLVSEIAHSLKQPNNEALRQNIKLLIIQTRNELIRRSYENHGYADKGLTQRFKIQLEEVYDGDIVLDPSILPSEVNVKLIKKSKYKVPKPVRFTNNLPFDRISSVGFETNREYPFIKETTARFRKNVPGLNGMPCYDYINGYLYIFPINCKNFIYDTVIVESVFENPTEIQLNNGEIDAIDAEFDDNDFLLSEDMIGSIKDIIYKRDLLTTVRENNEIPDTIKFKN